MPPLLLLLFISRLFPVGTFTPHQKSQGEKNFIEKVLNVFRLIPLRISIKFTFLFHVHKLKAQIEIPNIFLI